MTETAGIGHNLPPLETPEEFEAALIKAHGDLMKELGAVEMAAGTLPQAVAVTTDEDVEKIDKWVRKAMAVRMKVESTHKDAKAPWLARSRVVDGVFLRARDDLLARIKAIESRKAPYLRAKADKARAELEEQRRREAAAAAALREEENRKLQEAEEARRRAAEPEVAREALLDVAQAQSGAEAAGQAAREAEANAEAIEDAMAAPTHTLAKTGSSSLKSVWKHRVNDLKAMTASMGPLGPFVSTIDVEAALKRACKAEPRPDIPGVVFYEDFEVATSRRN